MQIALVNLPKYEIGRPPMALAILAAYAPEADCYDVNLMLYNDSTPEQFSEFEHYLEYGNFPEHEDTIKTMFNRYIESLLDYDLIAISVFSNASHRACEMFCAALRPHNKTIVIGGQGVSDKKWVQILIDNNLITDFISGEGEVSFEKYLKGEPSPGINNYDYNQIDKLDALLVPNYNGFELNDYKLNELYITGSRGCVRKCTFCDVPLLWEKYRYRSGQNIADEMIQQYELHGVTDFWFTDSLVNGSLKVFKDMCRCLTEYDTVKFNWKGQFIFKPEHQVDEEYFRLIALAGGDEFYVGLESGSDNIRWQMDKKFTNEDTTYHLEMFKKYGITCQFLMIGGHPEEQEQDHQDTLYMFSNWQKFVASGTIVGIELGNTLSIIPGTPLDKLNLNYIDSDDDSTWYNENSNLKLRIARRVEIQQEAIKYKWPITNSLYRLKRFSHLLDVFIVTNGL